MARRSLRRWYPLVLCSVVIVPLIVWSSTAAGAQEPSGYRLPEQALETQRDALQTKLDGRGFHVLIERPFIVVGDQSAAEVKGAAEGIVRWTVDRLKRDYFRDEPRQVIAIYLFGDEASYESNTLEFFGSKPTTPFGFYSSSKRAMSMNIATGGGTLVHEIVHPFIESNFPDCPSWFNEGLASLYEQSSDHQGHIVGLTNWRLAGLQKAISKDRLRSFESLCSTTTEEFYDDQLSGSNYAQARYLCYYLQEHGLLKTYYDRFVEQADDDPSGYQTLKQVLDIEDIEPFESQWRRYVLELTFP
jgi:hypothetical protein